VKRPLSVQQRLSLLFGGTFVALILLVGVATVRVGRSAAISTATERVIASSSELTALMANSVRLYSDSAVALVNSAEVAAVVVTPNANTKQALGSRLGLVEKAMRPFLSVELRDATGQLLIATADSVPPVDSARITELIASVRPPVRVAVGPLTAIKDDGRYEIIARRKIGGAPVYLIERWQSPIGSTAGIRKQIGKDARFLVGNARGDGWTDFHQPLATAPQIEARTDSGVSFYSREPVGESLARKSAIPGTPWMVLIEFPSAAIYARVNRVLRELGALVFFLVLGVIVVAWRIGKTFTRPLVELTAAAEAISAGILSRRVAVADGDEFGTVGAAFNRMADNLATARNELNVRLMQLTQSESHYRALFDSNPHAMWVYDIASLAFLAVNDSAVRRYGYSKDELLRMTLVDIRPADGLPAFWSLVKQAAGTDRHSHVVRHRRKDGTEMDVEVTSQSIVFDGHQARIVLATDISERIKMEDSLRLTRERFERVVASVGAVIYELDVSPTEIVPTWISDAALPTLGYDPIDTYDPGWWYRNLHPADRARLGQRTLADRLYDTAIEYRFMHKNGSYRWIRDEQRVTRDAAGKPLRVIGALIDVTTNHQLQEQLLQSQKVEAVGRLAGGVAHDFNNLLTVILGECSLALNEPLAQDPTIKPSIEAVQKAAERATLLTRQLLTFARKQLTEPVALSLNDVVHDTSAMLNRLIGEDILVNLNLEPALGDTLGDRGQIEQVLVNLSVNARDAMPSGGVLMIETSSFEADEDYAAPRPNLHVGSYVLLKVSDTGSGLSPDAQVHLFEPFFTTKERGKGTGLGLATCYSIVRQCDGHIEIQSEPGVGTTVRIYLPTADRHANRFAPIEKLTALIGEETILLVEDEDVVRRVTARMLESLGYTVLQAADGPSALTLLGAYDGTIDLLMSDVVMPRMGGRELAGHVVKSRPNISVLFASGYSDDVILNRQLLEGDVVLLQKPFTLASLSAKIREALERRMSRSG
jgi:two-component system cell cycle sensor histidine kinase/response regulator CckA